MIKQAFIEAINHYENEQRIIYPMWGEIETSYSSEGRFYHTLQHLDAMLRHLIVVKDKIENWQIVVLALCYHDLVYEPLQGDNEEQSAARARQSLSTLSIHHTTVERICDMILATKKHELSVDSDTNYFIDADLSILGSDEKTYEAYATAIRNEYSIVPDALYFPGRLNVLNHFLAMESIYKTEHFKNLLEVQARKNIEAEKKHIARRLF